MPGLSPAAKNKDATNKEKRGAQEIKPSAAVALAFVRGEKVNQDTICAQCRTPPAYHAKLEPEVGRIGDDLLANLKNGASTGLRQTTHKPGVRGRASRQAGGCVCAALYVRVCVCTNFGHS